MLLLEDYSALASGGVIFILRPETNFLPQRVRTFIDFLANRFAKVGSN